MPVLKKKRRKRCEDCKDLKDDVEVTACPYHEDMTGEKTRAVLCTDCYNERVSDV